MDADGQATHRGKLAILLVASYHRTNVATVTIYVAFLSYSFFFQSARRRGSSMQSSGLKKTNTRYGWSAATQLRDWSRARQK